MDEKKIVLKHQKLRDNLQKKVREKDFIDQVLAKCKEHEGPFTFVKEVKSLVKKPT